MFCRSQYKHKILTLKAEVSNSVLPNTISHNMISCETSSHIKGSQTAHSSPNLHTHTWQGAFLSSTSSRIYYLYCVICISPLILQKSSVCPYVSLPSSSEKVSTSQHKSAIKFRIGWALKLCNNQQFLSSAWRSHFTPVLSSSEETSLEECYLWGREKLRKLQSCGFT